MRKLNILSTAIAGILGAGVLSGVAHATTTASVVLNIGGATATDNTVRDLFLRAGTVAAPRVCRGPTSGTPGTIDVYIDGTDVTKNNSTAILCALENTLTAADGVTTLTAGTTVGFVKESGGGSDRGTVYIADATPMAFRSTTDFTGCLPGTTITAGSIPSFPNHQQFILHTNCTAVTTVAGDVGIADVDPQLFNVGLLAISQGQINKLTSDPLYQPMFGVAVSLNTYRALQAAQGLNTASDAKADVPTLTSGQIRGLFGDGVFSNWDAVTDATGNPVVPAGSQLYVCRRGDESGTQASTAQYFLNERCALNTGVLKFKGASVLADQQNGKAYVRNSVDDTRTVFAAKGGGDVRTCLDQHNDLGQHAIGLLGSDSVYDNFGGAGGAANANAGSNQWRYVAIDGRKPDLVSVANGQYDFVMENVLNRRNTTVSGNPVLSGGKLVLADYIKQAFTSSDIISSLIIKTQPHGYTGGLAGGLSGTPNAIPVTTANLDTNPVSAFTKTPGSSVNNCGPAIAVTATPGKL
jgi:hypothetical protein